MGVSCHVGVIPQVLPVINISRIGNIWRAGTISYFPAELKAVPRKDVLRRITLQSNLFIGTLIYATIEMNKA